MIDTSESADEAVSPRSSSLYSHRLLTRVGCRSSMISLKRTYSYLRQDENKAQARAGPNLYSKLSQRLIALQSFEGSFSFTRALAAVLGIPLPELEAKLMEFIPSNFESSDAYQTLWATVLVVTMFEQKLAGEKDVWELVVAKARDWITALPSVQDEDVKRMETLAIEVLAG